MQLDKFITQQLSVSHAIARHEIHSNHVTINGKIIHNAAFKLLPEHDVTYNGNPLAQQHSPHYFMLNKPQGYVCSTDNPDHPTVLYFLDEPVAWKLHTAGQLDIDTTSLVLMTDDGQWSHHITSPRHHCKKTYLVTLESPVADNTAEQFAKGMQLHNKKDLTKPTVLEVITPTQVHLTISKGHYHQVKHMFTTMGNHMVELHHEHIGSITLDADLAPSEYHPLTEEEIASII